MPWRRSLAVRYVAVLISYLRRAFREHCNRKDWACPCAGMKGGKQVSMTAQQFVRQVLDKFGYVQFFLSSINTHDLTNQFLVVKEEWDRAVCTGMAFKQRPDRCFYSAFPTRFFSSCALSHTTRFFTLRARIFLALRDLEAEASSRNSVAAAS